MQQYEEQLKTLQDLQERVEMIELRAKSAVLALQQLCLDIPRLRTAPAGGLTRPLVAAGQVAGVDPVPR